MNNPIITMRWKRSATATDMTEVLRACRSKGWRVETGLGLWTIFTRPQTLDEQATCADQYASLAISKQVYFDGPASRPSD